MKRIKTGKFYGQFYILPAIGLKKSYTYDSEEFHIALAWFNRGISFLVTSKKEQEEECEE